jgi:hypothetical protein
MSAFALPTSPFLQLRDHHTRRFIRYRRGLPGTHLDLAAVPAEDGGLALGQEVVPPLGRHLGAENLSLALQELGGDGGRDSKLIRQCGRPDHEVKGSRRQWRAAWRTWTAIDSVWSSSKRYSDLPGISQVAVAGGTALLLDIAAKLREKEEQEQD